MRLLSLIAAGLVVACAAPVTPPATRPASIALVNPGFESSASGRRNDPEGWFSFQHAGEPSYRFVVDTANPHGGARSLRIDNTGPDVYGAMAQSLDALGYAGKTARFSGWLRTNETNEGGAVLTILALGNGATLANNFMAASAVKGTTPWTRYTITLAIPPRTDRVEVGAMLHGKGSLWLDDVELTLE